MVTSLFGRRREIKTSFVSRDKKEPASCMWCVLIENGWEMNVENWVKRVRGEILLCCGGHRWPTKVINLWWWVEFWRFQGIFLEIYIFLVLHRYETIIDFWSFQQKIIEKHKNVKKNCNLRSLLVIAPRWHIVQQIDRSTQLIDIIEPVVFLPSRHVTFNYKAKECFVFRVLLSWPFEKHKKNLHNLDYSWWWVKSAWRWAKISKKIYMWTEHFSTHDLVHKVEQIVH